jgi:hypothetical protein
MRIVVLITKATLSSEGPRNYSLRLASLLRGLGLDVDVDIVLNNLSAILKVIYYIIAKEIVIIPYVKGIELLAIFLALPFATLRGSRIVIVNHDVHGLFSGNVPLLWHFLIIMQSGRLLDIPYSPIYIVYVSRYSKISSYLVTGSNRIFKRSNLCVFAKVAKMLVEDFWAVLCKCLSNIADERLVIMGSGSQADIDRLKAMVSRHCMALQDKIIFRFNVSDKERDYILESCKILIYPPSTEGLGMPVFEGLMLGVPVISARQTALLEFVPPWVYPYREYRDPDFCRAIFSILVDPDQSMKLQNYATNLRRKIIQITLKNVLYLLQFTSRGE